MCSDRLNVDLSCRTFLPFIMNASCRAGAHFYRPGLTLIPAWISNHMTNKVSQYILKLHKLDVIIYIYI